MKRSLWYVLTVSVFLLLLPCSASAEDRVVLTIGDTIERSGNRYMEGLPYRAYDIQLNPGDKIFVYTDGVPEATALSNEMFGTERMVAALNDCKEGSPEEILNGIKRAVDAFVGDAEQFDDLTMLCLEYKGSTAAGKNTRAGSGQDA